MANSYQDPKTAQQYLDFLNSKNGQIQQKVLFEALRPRLANNPSSTILDAGCGPGWLTGMIKKEFNNVQACDASPVLIDFAKKHYFGIDFKIASLDQPLAYSPDCFDCVILNMVAPDLSDLSTTFKNLSAVLKPDGKLLMTIPNPQYTYPAAEWKRNIFDVLLGRKPKLQFKNPPIGGSKIEREFAKGIRINSHYYTLDDYLKAANSARLNLISQNEIRSKLDSRDFDLNYQLYRFPILLLLEFVKNS